MAKKKITKYVFSPGIAFGDNLFPNAYALLTANKTFIQKEINAYLVYQSSGPLSAPTSRTNAVTLLTNNKDFIRFEATSWIATQVAGNIPPFEGYTYDAEKCRRDIGFIIDSFIADLSGGGNAETIRISRMYRYDNVLQLLAPVQEAAVYVFVRDLINNFVFPKVLYPAINGVHTQNVTGPAAESGSDARITTLTTIVTNAITIGTFPAISYNYNAVADFRGYTFDAAKCERDAGFVIDAYLEDLRYGGNKEIRFVSSKYWFGTVAQIDGSRVPEISTYQFVEDLINDYLFTNTIFATYQQDYNNKQVLTLGTNGEAGAATKITSETAILTSVITNGLTALPNLLEPQGTVKFQGRYGLEDLLLITNVTDGEVIYNFSDSTRNAIVQYETDHDPDFPKFLQTTDAITLVRLFYDTTGMSSTDKLQIFVEEKELKVRPYDFGTDAIERMRIANPQSMLDADFEYGLQPTKWQAISLLRGYPSIFELPATDTQVSSITTDASVGTGGVGQSQITVNTVGPHGLSVGTPITIRGLSSAVFGSNRAEGSFVVTSVPSSTQFRYFAKARVGTASGQVLSTPFTQLRQGGFYTGANIGTATFSVISNGTTGSFTTALGILSGENILPFTGTAPPLGAPVTLSGIPVGAQVTDVKGTGGTIVTTTPSIDANIGSNTITVTSTTSIATGQAIDRGDGNAIYVTNVVGSTVSFSGATTSYFAAPTATYNNVSGSNDPTVGTSATFDIARAGGSYTTVTVNNGGSGYKVGDNILILGTNLGGTSPAHDLRIRVTSVSAGIITGVVVASGTAFPGTGSYTGVSGTNLNNGGTVPASFNVTLTNNTYSVTMNGSDTSANYAVNDRIRISGTNLGGVNVTNDCIITVNSVDGLGKILTASAAGTAANAEVTYASVPYTTSSPGGNTAVIDVTKTGTVYSITVINPGIGYSNGETLTVFGSNLGGSTPTNNLTITIDTVSGPGQIATTSLSGTAANTETFNAISGTDLVGTGATFNVSYSSGVYTVTVSARGTNYGIGQQILIAGSALGGTSPANDLTITINTVGVSNRIETISTTGTAPDASASYTGVSGTNVSPAGSAATFNISRSSGTYTIAAIANSGGNYIIGNRIIIPGSSLGGSSPSNNVILRVTGVSGGAITTAVVDSGTAVTGSNINFVSTVTVSETSTAPISTGQTATFGALATIGVSFTTNHGLVPGSSFIAVIQSSGSNHEFAAGSFLVTAVPTLTSIRYQARAAGTIDTAVTLVGIIYPRPDSFFTHRPFDGGVQLGTGGPQHGGSAIRQSKKHIRYQSGKGIMYTTGALFAPSYDIASITAASTSIGSLITVTTDDVDHGLQVGGRIKIIGVETYGYNGEYTVSGIVSERAFRIVAQDTLGSATPTLGNQTQVSVLNWHGATVRAGAYDDQNGIFWQYDGQYLSVVQRSSTFQLAGTISINANSNNVTGTGTRFRDQLKAGDRIVIRGMTHVVSEVASQTSISVTPDYRGVNNVINAKCCLIVDKIVRQEDFNLDTLDGQGPSGYTLDITKMQMIGIQYSWYGAGFIDFMLRGADGNYVFAHRMRNSNINTEAYMRTGNMPVRYEVTNESANDRLAANIDAIQTFIDLEDATFFPNFGTVYIDNELITYTGKTNNRLTGCTRSSTLVNFVAGSQRSYSAGSAATHDNRTGVILISNTISPIISHWGSAFLTDGNFDEDRGYIFSYAATGVSVTTTKQTAFLIRLAPSVSNAVVGDLGDRELLNRAQLLLQAIEITSDTGTGGIVVEGVLNPQNYPTDPALISWSALSGSAQGGQPSFAQAAAGGSVTWSTGGVTTASATTQAAMTGIIIARAVIFSGGRSMNSGNNWFFVRESDFNTYIAQGLTTSLGITGSGIPANTVISSFGSIFNVSGTNHRQIFMSNNANSNITGDNNITVTQVFRTTSTSTIFFQQASWEASGARAGTEVQDPQFPGGTSVTGASIQTFFSTIYYSVTFNRTSTGSAMTPGTTTITFRFGAANFAQPGETVFSFIASPGTNSSLSLSALKELTNTTVGGRGTYPNGPDVLAINVYKATGAAVNSNIILRWGEAQA